MISVLALIAVAASGADGISYRELRRLPSAARVSPASVSRASLPQAYIPRAHLEPARLPPATLGRAHPLAPLPSPPAAVGREPQERRRESVSAPSRPKAGLGSLPGSTRPKPDWRYKRPEPNWTYRHPDRN